ncbi:hypothetical protein PFISCL1PPCAC_1178, partial [Pristionchus fissidentatus]
ELLADGVPSGAAEEFIANGFLYPPFDRKKIVSVLQWENKWQKGTVENDEFELELKNLNFDQLHKHLIDFEHECSLLFDRIYAEIVRELP